MCSNSQKEARIAINKSVNNDLPTDQTYTESDKKNKIVINKTHHAGHRGARVSSGQVQNRHGIVSDGCQMLRQMDQSPDGKTVLYIVLGHALQGP